MTSTRTVMSADRIRPSSGSRSRSRRSHARSSRPSPAPCRHRSRTTAPRRAPGAGPGGPREWATAEGADRVSLVFRDYLFAEFGVLSVGQRSHVDLSVVSGLCARGVDSGARAALPAGPPTGSSPASFSFMAEPSVRAAGLYGLRRDLGTRLLEASVRDRSPRGADTCLL
jgi:hypothetical protein